ncbi:hypothetical protein ACGFR8_23490 [Streptomyces brevispora]|uniref:hypothetical protein n=1 Tax=Streptomyces brevispora TaxID=887462 RepID=UPI003719C370
MKTAARPFAGEAAVSTHIGSALDLPVETDGHGRVLAVVALLRASRLPPAGQQNWSEPLTQLV